MPRSPAGFAWLTPSIPAGLPLSVALPAAAAVGAYINAKTQLYYDLHLLKSILPTVTSVFWQGFRGHLNLFYTLESYATSKSTENRIFLRFEDKAHSYAQIYDTAIRYGNYLKHHRGIKKGDLVALDFQNTDTFVFLLFGCWSIGARPALINYNLSGAPLVHCIKRAAARLILIDPVVAANVGDDVRSELPEVAFEIVTPELEQRMLAMEAIRPDDELRNDAKGDDMAMLIFTSGTTGLPKAAVVSWDKAGVVGGFTSRLIGTKTSDVFYTVCWWRAV